MDGLDWVGYDRGVMPRLFRFKNAFFLMVALGLGLGCATTRAPAGQHIRLEPVKVVAEPTGPDALEVYDAEILFKRGTDLISGNAHAEAAPYFQRILDEFPESTYVLLATYNLGMCHLELQRGEEALAAFDAYLKGLPEDASDRDRLDGRFKYGAALAVLKRYQEAADHFDEILGESLGDVDRIEALVDSGVSHFMLEDRYTSEYRFLEARRIYKNAPHRDRVAAKYFSAQAGFYLGELARLEYAEYKLSYPSQEELDAAGGKSLEELLGAQLEEKCQRLLRAQYAFIRSIRDGHPGWASAAGYKVGTMYEDLYDHLLNLPAPPDLDEEARGIYVEMLRDKVRILLTKAIKVWEMTTDMATRTGTENLWVERTRESLDRIKTLLIKDDSTRTAAAAPAS
jgi:tetratricopeptide (TPR) repeat protein